MALVPVVDRRTAGLAATLYHAYRGYQTARPYINQAMVYGKRLYKHAFGKPRKYRGGKRAKYSPRYKRPAPPRRPYTRRSNYRKPTYRLRRSKGRRGYGNQYMTFRANYHQRREFTQDGSGDFIPQFIEMDNPNLWFPNPEEIDQRKAAIFNNANATRLVSVHIYLKNIKYQEKDPSQPPFIHPQDGKFMTFADPSSGDLNPAQVAIGNHYMISNGVPAYMTRMTKKYHSVLKSFCSAKATTRDNITQLFNKKWKDITNEFDFFNKTGNPSSGARLNIDWLIVPEIVSCDTAGVTGCMKYEVVVATRWRIYSSQPGRPVTSNRTRRALDDEDPAEDADDEMEPDEDQ